MPLAERSPHAARERLEYSAVSLTRKLTVAGFAERRAWTRWGDVEKVIQARSRDEQQSVGRPRARHSEAAERGVELIEGRRARKRVDCDGDRVRLPLPRVDSRRDEHVVGQVVALRQALDHRLRVVNRLVSSCEDGDERVAVMILQRRHDL